MEYGLPLIKKYISILSPEELDNCSELKISDWVALTYYMMNLQRDINSKILEVVVELTTLI